MIVKTITDETTLSGQRIVGVLQARKIAQQQATAQLEIDIACLKEYQVACQNGTVTTEQFDAIMHKASASAVEYSAKVKAGTGTAQSYANAQRTTNSALQEVSIGAGIASKAVKLFSTALNMIAFTAIIQGISWLIGKFDEWIVTAKETKESADAFKQNLSTFFNETQTNLKTISSLSDRFNELSKNVDDTGKKIGGTEEEYAEFLDICQQVGQIMPELITGYTNEGETIITLQGKVDSLTDSYKEAIRTKAALFLLNGDEEGNSIKSFFEDYNDFVNGYQGVLGLKIPPSGQDTAEEFEEYYGYDKIHEWLSDVTDATFEELKKKLRPGTIEYVYLGRVLKEAGYEIYKFPAENYNAIHDVFNTKMSIMEKGITDRVTNIRTAFQNMLYADSEYWKINDENVISAINSIYASINHEFIKKNELFTQTALQTFESNLVSLFNNDATKQAMVDFYTPIADDETVQNYINRINSALQVIQSYCDHNGIVIPIKVNNSIDTLVNNVKEKLQDDFDDKVGELTLEELHIAAEKVEVPEGTFLSWDELIDKIKEAQSSTSNIENPISLPKIIDDYKNKLKELYAALNLLSTKQMTNSDMYELIKKFPELSEYVDDFDGGIRKLINDTLQLFGKSFNGLTGENGLKSISKLSVIQENVTNSIETTTNAINNLTSSYQTLDKAVKEYNENGYLSLETLNNLMKLNPEYLASIIDEEGNLKDVTEVYKELIDLKLKEFEIDAYKKANSVQAQLREEYKGRYDFINEEGINEFEQKFKASQKTLEQELKFIKSARSNLDKVVEGSGFGEVISSTSDFEQHIDWASHSINILQNRISTLQDTLSDTSGYDNQIEAINNIIEAQGKLLEGYENQSTTYQEKYENVLNNGVLAEHGLEKAAKEKIEKGIDFSIEDFIANNIESGNTSLEQELYEELQEAIDWYNKKSDTDKNILKIKAEIDESKMSKHDVWRKKWQSDIDKIEANQKSINDTIDFDGGKGKDRDKYYNALILDEIQIRNIIFERLGYEKALLGTLDSETDQYTEQEKIVRECEDGLAECDKNIKDWQLDIVHLELEAIDDEIDSINDKIKANQDEIDEKDKLISGAIGILNQEVKVQEGLRDVIQERIDALQEENDEHERALALEKAKYELQRAYSQRTVKLYSGEERGFIYTQDREAVRDAQENLDKLEYEETIHALQEQVGYYDDIIDNLNTIKDSWSNISSAAQEFLEIENIIAKYGVGIKDSILSGSYDTDGLTQSYKGLLHLGEEFDNDLKKQEDLRVDIEETIERFQNGTITYEQCLTDIGTLLGKVYDTSESVIQQSVEEIVKSTETIPAEVSKVNTAVKELEKNTKESTDNIKNELSDVPENTDKKSSETAERITKNLESELENQRIILEHFYEYVDNIFLNMSLSAIDYFQQITNGVKDMIASAKEEIDGIIPDTTNSSDQNNDGQNNSDQSKTIGSKPHISFENYPVNHSTGENSLALAGDEELPTAKDKESDSFTNSAEDNHITVLGHKDSKHLLTAMQNNEWEEVAANFPKLGSIFSSIYSSNHIPNVNNGMNTTPVVQNITLTLPNVTNENGYGSLVNVLKSLPLDTVQYTHKK